MGYLTRERMSYINMYKNLEKVECIGDRLRERHIKKTFDGGMGTVPV